MKENQKKKATHKIIYYEDELNDDFAGTNIKQKPIKPSFKFVHKNPIWRFFSWFIYYVIAIPVITFYCFLMKRVKFVNRKAIKKAKKGHKGGVFLYGNHTGVIDAYTPNIVSYPHRNKIVVSPDAVSIKGMKNIIQMLGAIPVPDDIAIIRKFRKALEYYNKKKFNITIYPEAHIWPYYTGVRNFKDTSFAYPVLFNSPVIAFFTAYSEPKDRPFSNIRHTNVTIYVSDPFYPNQNLSKKDAQKELRDKVYNFMKECSEKYSTYNYIEYKHISEMPNDENKEK